MKPKIIQPSSEKAKSSYSLISEKFKDAVDNLAVYGGITLSDLGVEWNPVEIKKGKGSRLEFMLEDPILSNKIEGTMWDNQIAKEGNIVIQAYDNADVIGRMYGVSNDDLFRYLSQAVDLGSKAVINKNGKIILPKGETGLVRIDKAGTGVKPTFKDIEEYKTFVDELIKIGEKVYFNKDSDGQFQDYVIVKAASGFYIAYNKNYGNGVYVATDLGEFEREKSELRETGDAIRINRSGPRWKERILEFAKYN